MLRMAVAFASKCGEECVLGHASTAKKKDVINVVLVTEVMFDVGDLR